LSIPVAGLPGVSSNAPDSERIANLPVLLVEWPVAAAR